MYRDCANRGVSLFSGGAHGWVFGGGNFFCDFGVSDWAEADTVEPRRGGEVWRI